MGRSEKKAQPSFNSSFGNGPPRGGDREAPNRSSFGSFRSNNQSNNDSFRSNNHSPMNNTNNNGDRMQMNNGMGRGGGSNYNMNSNFGASEDDNDWRKNKKPKEQPKVALNSHISSSNNANPWSSSGQDLGRSAFGSKSQNHSMNSSPNRYGDSSSYNPRAQSQGFGASKFGSERKSKFGGSSSANATPSKPSKFNKGGGFGAALLKKIDNGTTRVTYAKNNRFSAIMDDDSPNTNSASL